MTGLRVDADVSDSVDLFGKVASDLQEGVAISGSGISGTLKYIDDYSSAYGSGMDSGNYLVLHAEVPGVEGVTLTSEVVGGTVGPVTLDEDGIVISRITNKSTQTIRVVASKDGYDSITKTFSLKGLTLTPAPAGT